MKKVELVILVYIITVVLSVMYATQPIQPLLAKEFDIDVIKASSFTAIILFLLAVAPIIYGYILERFSAKKMLKSATIILFVTNIFLGFSNSYEMFFTIRVVEGLVIPAILTSAMSILANLDKKNIKFNMSVYVASTVFGGIVGRVVSGFIATSFGWRWVFFTLSFELLVALFFVYKINYKGETNLIKGSLKDMLSILKDRRFVAVYFLMFGIFFVFAGLLNILPFRIKELDPNATETKIGLMYLGYSTGIVVSLISRKIVKLFKGEINTILFATLFFAFITIFFVSDNITFIFFLLFIFCIGMFTIHSIASGLANTIKKDKKALTSGMYLTFYYVGGSFGSVVPSIVYKNFGWNFTISIFVAIVLSIFLFVWVNRNVLQNYEATVQ